MANPNLDEDELVDQEASADDADGSPVTDASSQQEQTDEASDLEAANDKRAADEVAQADALKKQMPDDSSDEDSEDSKASDSKVKDEIDADDDKTEAPEKEEAQQAADAGVNPAMLAAYNSVKDDKTLSPLEKKQAMMDTYKQLLEEQRKGLAQAAVMQGANKVAQGMAMKYGGNPGDNAEGVKTMQDMANLPVNQYLQNQLNQYRMNRSGLADAQAGLANAKTSGMVELNDPNSARSKSLQGLAKKQYMAAHPNAKPEDVPDFSTTSGADLLKIGTAKQGGLASQKMIYKDIMGPDNKVHTYAIDPATNKPVADLGVKGLAARFRVDPTTGNLVGYSGAGFALPPGAAKTAAPGMPSAMPQASVAPGTDSDQTEAPAKPATPPEITMDQLRNTNNRQADFVQKQADLLLRDSQVKALRIMNSKETNLEAKLGGEKIGSDGLYHLDAGLAEPIAAQAAALSMGGVPPEGVMAHFGGKQGWTDKVNRLLTVGATGHMAPQDVQFFKDYSSIMKGSLVKSAQDAAQSYISHVANQFPQGTMTRENAAKLLGANELIPNIQPTKLVTIVGPSGQMATMKKENAQKYLSQPGYSLVPNPKGQ